MFGWPCVAAIQLQQLSHDFRVWVPSAAAAVTLVVICLFPGQDWGRVSLYKPSTGTGYLQRQRTQLKEL